jgi:osmotically-inducible protein OsmY
MIITAIAVLGITGSLLATDLSARIESSAKKSYVFKTYLKGEKIKAQATNDGVVTLTGTVSAWSHRSLAEETVANIYGVTKVENKLEVKGEQAPENSDAWIHIKVKTMLMFHRNVSGLKTDVDVKDGIVVLRGKAESEAQKELTTEYAKDVDGVVSVNNEMTVPKHGKNAVEKANEFIDDASITAQVKLALLFHKSTSVVKTTVETKNGIVTVRGVAKNEAEKDLVGKLVNDIHGVNGLKNEMTTGS